MKLMLSGRHSQDLTPVSWLQIQSSCNPDPVQAQDAAARNGLAVQSLKQEVCPGALAEHRKQWPLGKSPLSPTLPFSSGSEARA